MSENLLHACVRCKSPRHVRPKAILIGAASPVKRFNGEEKAGYRRLDQLAIDECKPEVLKEAPLEQLVDGFYCDLCGLGFVASEILREERRTPDYATDSQDNLCEEGRNALRTDSFSGGQSGLS